MTRRTRRPDPAEIELWRAATRDITPLPHRAAPDDLSPEPPASAQGAPAPPADRRGPPPAAPAAPPPATAPAPPAALSHGRGAELDRRQAERLRRGRMPIEGRIDLHGMTQAEAHDRLNAFITDAAADGRRCVLVITGKGLGRDGTGILREAVPRWLNQAPLRAHVLMFAYAQPRHGGMGALYVLLRRKRDR